MWVVKEPDPKHSYLLIEACLISCFIAVLCRTKHTTRGSEGVNNKLFSDGLISVKFKLQII